MAFTNIPTVNPFKTQLGSVRHQFVKSGDMRDLIKLDRTVFASRFNNICSHYRGDSVGSLNNNLDAYSIGDNWHCMFKGVIYTVPDVLPGTSAAVLSMGDKVDTRGGLVCNFRGEEVEVWFGMRPITIAGTYGQDTTFGSWTWATGANPTTTIGWSTATHIDTDQDGFLMFPDGTVPGDTFELCMWAKSTNVSGRISGWNVSEVPDLTGLTPPLYIPGVLGIWVANDAPGDNGDSLITWDPSEDPQALGGNFNSGVAWTVVDGAGPDGGRVVRAEWSTTGGYMQLHSVLRNRLATAGEGTAWALLRNRGTPSHLGWTWSGNSGSGKPAWLQSGGINSEFLSAHHTGPITITEDENSWHVGILTKQTDGTLRIYWNGVEKYNGNPGPVNVRPTIWCPYHAGNGYSEFAEIGWSESAISAEKAMEITNHLRGKYGI